MIELKPSDPRPGLYRAARSGACRAALSAALLAALAGCGAPAPRVAAPDRTPPANTHEAQDASYDWHGLLIAPFGSVLKDIPLTLHEVLLFRDEAHGAAAADDGECYASATPAPRFVGRTPDEYLLCFKQDRLSRIQASVRLTTEQAPQIYAAACALWSRNAASARTTPAGTPNAGARDSEAESAVDCRGRDGTIHYSGRLGEETGQAKMPQTETPPTETPPTETAFSITLDSAPSP
jgi:hypothetical protein